MHVPVPLRVGHFHAFVSIPVFYFSQHLDLLVKIVIGCQSLSSSVIFEFLYIQNFSLAAIMLEFQKKIFNSLERSSSVLSVAVLFVCDLVVVHLQCIAIVLLFCFRYQAW